jgi:hypothetical protein
MRKFSVSAIITLAAIVAVGITLGLGAALTTLVLIAIEIAFSLDNAIVNAKILERLSENWRRLFLTVGIIIAVIGMRFLFPVLIVVLSAHLSFAQVISEALNHPGVYARHLTSAHEAIAAFGGSFLLTLALYFLLDDNRRELWIEAIERPLQKFGGHFWLPPVITVIIIIVLSSFSSHSGQVLSLGVVGAIGYGLLKYLIDSISGLESGGRKRFEGKTALMAFLYLQLLDAAFSFDGVLGAFAITTSVVLIAVGLGVGALWVRSFTIHMVEKNTLKSYIYLEHGAHYAIFVLAAVLLLSLFINIPDLITGIVGLGIIASSFGASLRALEQT